MNDDQPRTARGFRIFLADEDQLYGDVSVNESSIAFRGAHCWVRQKLPHVTDPERQYQSVHLNVAGAIAVRDAPDAFIAAARAGELVEPVESAEDEEQDDE
jgi:hypothetical protein